MEAARFREAARMGGGGGEQDDAVQGRSGRMATVTWMTGVALGGVETHERVAPVEDPVRWFEGDKMGPTCK